MPCNLSWRIEIGYLTAVQLVALSAARILEFSPNAEERLFPLLIGMGQRFGRVSSRGVSLCFEEMNLTHRTLAERSGLTRVTVTKAISQFRQAGALVREGEDDWLLPEAWGRSQR